MAKAKTSKAAAPAEPPHLRIVHVDQDTGQPLDRCPGCVTSETQIEMLERDLQGKRLRIAELEANRDAEARAHKWWPRAVRLFDIWRERSGHTRCEWTGERFWIAVPALRKFDDYMIERGIAGLCYDPHKSDPLKRGGVEIYNWWENLFLKNRRPSTANVERYANRAPRDYAPPPPAEVTDLARGVSDFVLERSKLIEETEDGVDLARILVEIDRRVREFTQT